MTTVYIIREYLLILTGIKKLNKFIFKRPRVRRRNQQYIFGYCNLQNIFKASSSSCAHFQSACLKDCAKKRMTIAILVKVFF